MTPGETFANDLGCHTKIRCATPTSKVRDVAVQQFIPSGRSYPISMLLRLWSRMTPLKRDGGKKIGWKNGLRGLFFSICHPVKFQPFRQRLESTRLGTVQDLKREILKRRPLVQDGLRTLDREGFVPQNSIIRSRRLKAA